MVLRFVGLLALCVLLTSPASAQDAGRVNPTDFLPLEVGNRWTYEHDYQNNYYSLSRWGTYEMGSDLRRVFLRAILEIPGYPSFPESFATEQSWKYRQEPPDDLVVTWKKRRFTIEITHTEIIEGQEYFVFSSMPYDWPPVPSFFLAGQKVRFSDEGALLIRWNGQDVPFYRIQEDASYITPKYPVLLSQNFPIEHTLQRFFIPVGRPLQDDMEGTLERPSSLSQASAVAFGVSLGEKGWEEHEYIDLGAVCFLAGNGLIMYKVYWPEWYGNAPLAFFVLSITPVSSVIGGQQLAFSYTPKKWTSIQPTTWGQLKAHHLPRP